MIKEWEKSRSYSGVEINNPYNCGSWELVKYGECHNPSPDKYVYGEINFTITDLDLGN